MDNTTSLLVLNNWFVLSGVNLSCPRPLIYRPCASLLLRIRPTLFPLLACFHPIPLLCKAKNTLTHLMTKFPLRPLCSVFKRRSEWLTFLSLLLEFISTTCLSPFSVLDVHPNRLPPSIGFFLCCQSIYEYLGSLFSPTLPQDL